jgi:putative FmdB family regulatory protein
MPLYDYLCTACNEQKEVHHAISEIGKIEVVCDQCGTRMKKQLSAPTLIGFDNVGRSISKKDKSENSSKTSDSGSASKDAA